MVITIRRLIILANMEYLMAFCAFCFFFGSFATKNFIIKPTSITINDIKIIRTNIHATELKTICNKVGPHKSHVAVGIGMLVEEDINSNSYLLKTQNLYPTKFQAITAIEATAAEMLAQVFTFIPPIGPTTITRKPATAAFKMSPITLIIMN